MNEGKRDILIFPKFNNINKIQNIRLKHDHLATLVPPHITLAFPFSDRISDEELIIKMKEILINTEPFKISFKGISLSQDKYISLNCVEGNDEITRLHNEIYSKILNKHNKRVVNYIPHITLGKITKIEDLENLNDTFTTIVNEIIIEKIGKNEESIIIKKMQF